MENPLWNFSLAVYAKPGVEAQLLHLQDELGADCNVLLAIAWQASRGRALDAARWSALLAHSEMAQRQCLAPLRALRRRVKTLTAADSLYEEVKALELAAERWQQDGLLPLLEGAALAVQPALELALAHCQRYGEQLTVDDSVHWSHCSHALMQVLLSP